MASTIRSRILKGLGSQAIAQPINFGIQLLSVPLFLHYWGLELYGEWLILAAVPAYLAISHLGFTTATTHDMSMRIARGDQAGALASFQTTWLLITSVSGFVALVILIAGGLTPFASWFGFSRIDQGTALSIVAVLAVQVLLNLQQGLLASGLISQGALALSVVINSLSRLFSFCVLVAAIASGGGPLDAAFAMALGPFIGLIAVGFFARRTSPWLHYGMKHVSRKVAYELLFPSLGALGFVVGTALTVQGPLLVLGIVVDPSAAAIFSTLRMSARGVWMVVLNMVSVIHPEISFAVGKGQMDRAGKFHEYLFQGAVWIGGSCLFALWLLGDLIFQIWTGGKIQPVEPTYIYIILGVYGSLIWSTSVSVLYAANRAQTVSFAYVAQGITGIALATMFGKAYGISGIAAAYMVIDWLMLIFVLSKSLQYLDEPMGKFLRSGLQLPTEVFRILLKSPKH